MLGKYEEELNFSELLLLWAGNWRTQQLLSNLLCWISLDSNTHSSVKSTLRICQHFRNLERQRMVFWKVPITNVRGRASWYHSYIFILSSDAFCRLPSCKSLDNLTFLKKSNTTTFPAYKFCFTLKRLPLESVIFTDDLKSCKYRGPLILCHLVKKQGHWQKNIWL